MREHILYSLFLLSSWICCGHVASSNFGGQVVQDPNNPKYQKMAEDVLRTHLKVKAKDTKKVTVNKVTTQVVAGIVTRIQFRVSLVNGKSSTCNSEIWEKPWESVKLVSYDCDALFGESKKLSSNTQSNSRPEQLRDPKNPKYHKLAQLALGYYFETPGSKPFEKEDIKSLAVTKVKVKLNSQIGSSLVVEVTTHNKGHFSCKVSVVETPWNILNTTKVTDMNCYTSKFGGEEEQDPKNPIYKKLAADSFEEYRKTHKARLFAVKEIQVDKVTTQSVAGTVTRLDFSVITDSSYKYVCHSEVLERQWLKVKDIKVRCNEVINHKYSANSLEQSDTIDEKKVGGEEEQDPKNPIYKKIAADSFEEYRKTHKAKFFVVKEIEVLKVTTQPVAGTVTRLDFDVITDSSYKYVCHSEVLEQQWLKVKNIKVRCNVLINHKYSANSLEQSDTIDEKKVGGEEEQDPKNPIYKKLAADSFEEYRKTHKAKFFVVKEIEVLKVTTQPVAGTVTRLDFDVITDSSYKYVCHSEVLEQQWLKVKNIKVRCNVLINHKYSANSLKLSDTIDEIKVGGEEEQDPKDPRYKQLAEDAFKKYRAMHIGPLFSVKELKVTRVTSQIVTGTLYEIDFKVLTDISYTYNCHSSIVDQPWLKKKDIDVTCTPQSSAKLLSTEIYGGETEQDPKNPTYIKLAKESFQKYQNDHLDLNFKVKSILVTKVTTQLVSGFITKLNFKAIPTKGNTLQCHSFIFEKSWEQIKDITVTCTPQSSAKLLSRGIDGGVTEQDPNDPTYIKLAKESFQKYQNDHLDLNFKVKSILVTKVTTQLVSGLITKLDFKAIPTRGNSLLCHSEIFEKSWEHIKDITVTCTPGLYKLAGSKKKLGQGLQDIAIDEYFSGDLINVVQKSLSSSKSITTRVGKKRIDYFKVDVLVSDMEGNYYIYNCSVVFRMPIPVPIGVKCHQHVVMPGSAAWTDPSDKKFIPMAQKAINKYSLSTYNDLIGGSYDVIVTFATKRLLRVWYYNLDFSVKWVGLQYERPDLKCHAIIEEEEYEKINVVKVNCKTKG